MTEYNSGGNNLNARARADVEQALADAGVTIFPEDKLKRPIFRTVIQEEKLLQYEEAAKATGYRIKVSAHAGEVMLMPDFDINRHEYLETVHEIVVSPRCIGIEIIRPTDQRNYKPFSTALRQFEKPVK